MDFETVISMSGYSRYVWGAYGVGIVLYGALMMRALHQYYKYKKKT